MFRLCCGLPLRAKAPSFGLVPPRNVRIDKMKKGLDDAALEQRQITARLRAADIG